MSIKGDLAKWWSGLGQRRRVVLAGGAALALIAILVIVTLLVLPRAAPGVRLPVFGADPWPAAIKQAQERLDKSPDFVSDMQGYRSVSADIDGYLALIERARLAATAIDDLHKLNIPLIGNAWSMLVKTLNALIPSSGASLDGLDESLHQVLAMKDQMKDLRDADAVAVAVQTFREDPSRKNLIAMRDTMAYYTGVLIKADQNLQPHLAAVNSAMERIDGIQQALRRAEDTVNRVPLLPAAGRKLSQSLSDLFTPLRNLSDALNGMHGRLQEDLATMRDVQDIVAAAEHPATGR